MARAPPVDQAPNPGACGQAVDAADPDDPEELDPDDPDDPDELEEEDDDDEDDEDDDDAGVEAGFELDSDLAVELPALDLLFAAARESVR